MRFITFIRIQNLAIGSKLNFQFDAAKGHSVNITEHFVGLYLWVQASAQGRENQVKLSDAKMHRVLGTPFESGDPYLVGYLLVRLL